MTKQKPKTGRNWHALNAIQRKAVKFKHKTAAKGGSNNWRNNLNVES